MGRLRGVDVSKFQTAWPATGVDFVIIKATEGHTYVDPLLADHTKLAEKRNLPHGFYHYLWPGNLKLQARYFVEHAKPKPGDWLVCDWERMVNGKPVLNTHDKDTFIKEVKRLCPHIQVGLYCNSWWWKNVDNSNYCGDFLWIADYGPTDGVQHPIKFWQYSDTPIDENYGYFNSVADLKAWSHALEPKKAAPKVAAPKVTTLKGTVLDLSEVPTGKGTRFKFRDRLTNTAGTYPGCVCSCTPRYIALVEALAREAGLPVPLKFWEGSFIVTKNSGQTHAGGGAFDINISHLTNAEITKLVKICRTAGAAAWFRDEKHGGFDTPHIHVEIIGCPDASPAAKAQWDDYKHGRDGLEHHGPDYGPKVAYISADDAYAELTKTPGHQPKGVTEKHDRHFVVNTDHIPCYEGHSTSAKIAHYADKGFRIHAVERWTDGTHYWWKAASGHWWQHKYLDDAPAHKPQPKPAPKPEPKPEPVVSLSKIIEAARRDPSRPQGGTTPGAADDVKLVEKALHAEGLLPAKWDSDGSFGLATVGAYASWQRRNGYRGKDANGIPGETSLKKLGEKHGFKVGK